MRLERLLGIIRVLTNREKITIQELAEKFEVSKRTIFRDLETLDAAGIPVISFPGYGGGVSVIANYKVSDILLTRADKIELFTALNGMKSIMNDEKLRSLMAKLVPEEADDLFQKSNYHIDFNSWFSDSPISEKMVHINQAIEEHQYIDMTYISKNNRSESKIEPYKLIFKQPFWYLYGFCLRREGFRLFRLNRISSYNITQTTYSPRPVEPLKFETGYGSEIFKAESGNPIYTVTLEYDKGNEFWLTGKIDALFFQREEDSQRGLINFQTADLQWTAELVMGMLDKVTIIAPLELREIIIKHIFDLQYLYEGDI